MPDPSNAYSVPEAKEFAKAIPTWPGKVNAEPSLGHGVCPICGRTVKKENLRAHYEKVHRKRASSFSFDKPTIVQSKRMRNHPQRKLLFYGLLAAIIILISTVAAIVVNENTVRLHIQLQLSVLIEGVPSTVPSGIGIEQSLWRDHSLDQYGAAGHSPLTTRDTSGTIRLDSNTVRNFTLQEFLRVWGETVDDYQVVGNQVPPGDSSCIVVNGQTLPATSNVVLVDKQRITIEIIQGSCSYLS